jgi:hypothetical protein
VSDTSLVHRDDIVPFYFPCSICGVYSFHMVYEERHGTGTEIASAKVPLASSDRAYLLVCAKCTATSATLDQTEVDSLSRDTIPKSIHSRYPNLQTFYNPAFFEQQKRRNLETLSTESAERIDSLVRHYRLES